MLARLAPARLTSLSQACLRCTAPTVLTVRTTDTPRTTLETADITSQLRLTAAKVFFFFFFYAHLSYTAPTGRSVVKHTQAVYRAGSARLEYAF